MYLAATVVALFAVTRGVAAQDQVTGNWEGYWSRAGDTMPVRMRVQRDSGTGYSAAFDVDRLRVIGIPFNEVTVQGCCDVTFTVRGDRTTTTLVGQVRGDSLSGALREGQSEGRFAFSARRRTAFNEQEITFYQRQRDASGIADSSGRPGIPCPPWSFCRARDQRDAGHPASWRLKS
jgi:hypothetical protein